MLINDFDWNETDIEACNNEDIFRPKNIGVIKYLVQMRYKKKIIPALIKYAI